MTFLEAKKIIDEFAGEEKILLRLCMSGLSDPLELFIRAAAAKRGLELVFDRLEFNTLDQYVLTEHKPEDYEVFLLFPWDLCKQANWRTGIPQTIPNPERLLDNAREKSVFFANRDRAKILYVSAPVPPLTANRNLDLTFVSELRECMKSQGARILDAGIFGLGGYFQSGCPISALSMDRVGDEIVNAALSVGQNPREPSKAEVTEVLSAEQIAREPCKLIVTDLDNTLWSGILAEDGRDGIRFDADGEGYKHFIFQTYLKRLKEAGVLLASVSRNDIKEVKPVLESADMVLSFDDFVAVIASYEAKSAQVRMLSEKLNMGLESIVLIDDNNVELAEVESVLGRERCLQFQETDDGFQQFLDNLAGFCSVSSITEEDRTRTAFYKRRLSNIEPSKESGKNLQAFLKDCRMSLSIRDRTKGTRARSVQLINKTNQFNLNGRRLTDEDVQEIIDSGGRLFSASLDDHEGSHGEILACLIGGDGCVESFVISCRVFQRYIEHHFLAWLAGQDFCLKGFRFVKTERNESIQKFFKDCRVSVQVEGDFVPFDTNRFLRDCEKSLNLIEIGFS